MPGIEDLLAQAAGTEKAGEAAPETKTPEKPAPAVEAPADLGFEDSTAQAKGLTAALGEQRAKRRELEGQLKSIQSELAEAKKGSPFQKEFDTLYGQFEKPTEQMREDAQFAQAVWDLREDPDVKKALAKIQQHHAGSTKAVKDRDAKPVKETKTETQADPRVEALIADRVKEHASTILTAAKVRPELHAPILAYVEQHKPGASREAVQSVIKEYVQGNGWTREFLVGEQQKPRRAAPVATPAGQGGGVPIKVEAPKTPERPKSLDAFQRESRAMLRDKIQQRGA